MLKLCIFILSKAFVLRTDRGQEVMVYNITESDLCYDNRQRLAPVRQ